MTSNVLPTVPPPQEAFKWSSDLASFSTPHNLPPHCSLPLPTNSWWANLLGWVPHPTDQTSSCSWCQQSSPIDSKPIFANPYTYRLVGNRGLAVSYLHPSLRKGELRSDGSIPFYSYPVENRHLVLSATEWTTNASMQLSLKQWDDLGVTMALSKKMEESSFAETYLAQGNAFTTMQYHALHVRLEMYRQLVQVNGEAVKDGDVFEGTSFVLSLANGHTWVVFCYAEGSKQPIHLQFNAKANALVATNRFSGIVQVAFVTKKTETETETETNTKTETEHRIAAASSPKDDIKPILEVYRRYAGCFATHAKLFVEEDGAAFGYAWRLRNVRRDALAAEKSTSDEEADQYLHFVLPHLDMMIDESFALKQPALRLYSQTRGPMQAYSVRRTNDGMYEWRFQPHDDLAAAVKKQAASFLPSNPEIPKKVVEELKLEKLVKDELAVDWQDFVDKQSGYYFKGKALQKLGNVCLVAWQLQQSTHPKLAQVAKDGIQTFRTVMDTFIANNSAHPLVYDTVYRGIITSEAAHTKQGGADFGNALYNDHHYHYGYIVMAASMLLYLENEVAGKDAPSDDFRKRLCAFIETLIRDVANPNAHDAYFPRFRYFSWFVGHSYSHGVVPLEDGKDEESTSEEVNFYYGVALYAKVTQNAPLERLAKLMLEVNIHAIQTYILLEDENAGVHPPEYAKNLVTGIYFDNKCDYKTWFSDAIECIHGIQMIPVSPINDVLRTKKFIEKEWQQKLKDLACVKDWKSKGSGWTSLLFSNSAVLNVDAALDVLTECEMDSGLSRAWALYMAATKKEED